MTLHRLTSVTIGVPNVEETAAYYVDFGLTPNGDGTFQTLEHHPERHVWGLGRHYIGSNFFWYLRDPAGNFTEYYSDMDCIIDDQLWQAEVFDMSPKTLFSWGPPPPPSFIMPEDLAAHMVGAHSSR